MEKIRLLIVDADKRFAELAQKFLDNFPDVEVVGVEGNGQEAFRCIRSLHPDAVLFDAVLPGMDGIALLRNVNELVNPPVMICCTRFFSDVTIEAMRTYGAAYIMFKPVELQAVHPAIVSCTKIHRKIRNLNKDMIAADPSGHYSTLYIRNYIVSLGVPSKLIGCSYLTEAVRLAREDVSLTHNLSKGLYLEISRIMNSSPVRIERCIRNAISAAYHNGVLEERMASCPSNKEFINYVLRTLEI